MPDPTPFFQADPAPTQAHPEHALELVKHARRYVFDCPPGKEADTLAQLAVLIDDETNDLTWFDAALLCHQLGQRMGRRLSHLRRPA